MRYKFFIYLTTVLAVFVFACTAAADIYDPGVDIETSFAEAIDNDAVFKTANIQETANLVQEFNDESATSEARLVNGLSSMKEVVYYARRKLDPETPLEADLLKSIDSAWRQLSGSQPINDLSRATNWVIDQNEFTVTLLPNERILNFKATYLDQAQSSPDTYRNAIDSLGVLLLTQRTLNYINRKPALEKIGSVARKRKAQWQVYFDESIPQWPWELAFVNGPIYKHTLEHEMGLGKLPDWQLIVVHPDVALEYVAEAADGDQFKPALMVEILGANFWTWEGGAKQKGPWGLSTPLGAGFVATFADRADSDDWGFGGVIHINHIYNIGATVRDGDTGFFVNVNLAKLLENKRQKANTFLNMVGL